MTLGGTNVLAGNVSLTGANVTVSGTTTASQGFTASAQGTVDTSAAQIYVTHDASLSGATVKSGSMIVGGSLTETATQAIATSGQTLVSGAATFNAGSGAFTNSANNQVLAGGALTVNGGTITNGSGAALASTSTTALTATSNMTNAGTINGQTTTINVGGNLANGGGTILGSNAVAIGAATIGNANGLVIAGNPFQTGATTGNLSLTVTGGAGAFDNTSGQMSAAKDAAFSLANMAWDPSAAVSGGIYAGGQLSMTVNSLSVGGTWNVNAGGASITALNGATITGAIQSSGAFSLASNGLILNYGQIVGGSTVALNGALENGHSALVHANGDLNLSGVVDNLGTLEAQGNINASGTSFYNASATTQAQGNVTLNFSGDVNNTGGKIVAASNVNINAASIVNDQTLPSGASTVTQVVNDSALLWSGVVGTQTWAFSYGGCGECDYGVGVAHATATLGNLLSPTGAWGALQNVQTAGGTSPCRVDCTLPSATPISGSGTVTFGAFGQYLGTDNWGNDHYGTVWSAVSTPVAQRNSGVVTLTLPTVYETTTSQQPGVSGVISAGNAISLVANSLSNRGGQIGAAGDIALRIQSLSNGAVSPTTTVHTVDWVDPGQFAAFVNSVKSLGMVGVYASATTCSQWDYGCTPMPPTLFTLSAGAAPTAVSTVTWSTATGLIAAGHDLDVQGGASSLVNEGTLYAQNNVNLSGAHVVDQGGHTQSFSSQAGCASGTSNVACENDGHVRGENPNTSTFVYTQDNASIIAGNDLTISAGTIDNTYGNLIAGHNIVVTGVSTSAGGTTAAQTLTNTSGNILAGNDITLNVSGAITNTLPPPVPVHQNYGSAEQYSGCMTAGGYKESYCEAYVDQQSGDSSIISAGHDLNMQAGTLTNVGSLITAGVKATVNVAGPVVNQEQTLNAYWHSHWVQETGMFSSDKRHEQWGCGSAAECTALYGSAYTNVGGAIDPPTPVGNIAATIEAPNLTVTSGGKIINVGNVIGQSVTLTGTNLANGITKSNTYTPTVGNAPQVISLAPAAGGLNLSIPATLGGYTLTQMKQTLGPELAPPVSSQVVANVPLNAHPGASVDLSIPTSLGGAAGSQGATPSSNSALPSVNYVLGGTGTTLDPVSPQLLLSNLPSNLQPSTSLFYYNPQAEDAALQAAALKQTGQATFVNGLSSDSQLQLSVTDQEKVVLYANATEYAKANNLQLGQALTQQQIGELTQPMLWYVEQTVPEPGCKATGSLSCPTITALMPQVYLPANTSSLSADGNIVASDSIKLNFGDKASGGSILNTGTIASGGSLTVNTGTLTNQQNQVDVGEIWHNAGNDPESGYVETTGTTVQPGGFMSAAAGQMTLNVSQLNQIGGLLQEVNPDGSVNNAATQQLLGQVLQDLGSNFSQTSVSDDLHTHFVAAGGFGMQQIVSMVAAVALTALGMPILGAMLASTLGQLGSGQGFSFGQVLEAGAVALATEGLDSGLQLNSVSLSQVGGDMESGIATTAEVAKGAEEVIGQGLVSSAVNTAVYGGSFGQQFEDGVLSNLAAVGAGAIGAWHADNTSLNAAMREVTYVTAHGVLGCAASAAEGTGCGGGAIGGAASALVAPLIRDGLYNGSETVTTTDNGNGTLTQTTSYNNTAFNAITAGIATLSGGLAAGLAGQNAQAGATSAENEVLNNTLSAKEKQLLNHAYGFEMPGATITRSDAVTTLAELRLAQNDPNLTATERGYLISASVSAFQSGVQAGVLTPNDAGSLVSAAIASMAFSGGGEGPLPGGASQSEVLPTTSGSRTATSLGGATSSAVSQADLDALAANGVKFTSQNVISTGRTPSGQIVFMETGNATAGLQHIIDEHADDFANIGVAQRDISSVVMQAVTEGNIVGYQGSGTGRPIYQVTINGQPQRIAVTVGSNGFIVGANPAGRGK
ncbi:hypothetical protein LMG24076_02391 [Trinickia soli]|nr:hypothetical protein LMG24076_02391 [Trinickia soli]